MLIRMHHNGGRQAVFDAESDGLMTMAGVRYGTGNSSNIGLLLASHVGDSISQTRVGRDDVKIENPVLSIGILSQPDTLRALAGVPGSKGRGLVDRFLIAAPPDRLGYRRSQTTPMSENTKAAFTGLITAYAVTLWSAATQTIRMSEEAREAILAYQDSCEERLRPGGDLRAMNGFGGKLVGSVARLAALHHLAHYGPAAGFAMPVHENSVQWAISVAEWSLEHYRYAVGQVGEVGSVSDAERVLNWLRNRTRRTAIVAQRDVQRECRFADAEQTKNALEILADHNWVRLGKTRKASNGRPPLNWEVHPSLVGEGMDAAA
jgi:hypothetical protein